MKKFLEKVLNFAGSIPKILAFLGILSSYVLATKFFVHQFFPPLSFFPYIYMRIAPYYVYHPYYATSIGIGILGIFVCVILFVMILRNKNTLQKGKYALIAFLVGLLSHVLFFICTPQYVYNFHPQWLMYKSLDGKYIVNKDMYFYFVKKYGYSYSAYARFKTVEDNIEGLEFISSNNISNLYVTVFNDMKYMGYKNVLEKYNEITFQFFFLQSFMWHTSNNGDGNGYIKENFNNLEVLINKGFTQEIRDISKDLYTQYSLVFSSKEGNINEKLLKIKNDFSDKIWYIKGFNRKMLYEQNPDYMRNQQGIWIVLNQ